MDKEENAPCPKDQPELEGFGADPLWNLPLQENQTKGVLGSCSTDPGGYSRKTQLIPGKGLSQDPLAGGNCPAGRAWLGIWRTAANSLRYLGKRISHSLWKGMELGILPGAGAMCWPAQGGSVTPNAPHICSSCPLFALGSPQRRPPRRARAATPAPLRGLQTGRSGSKPSSQHSSTGPGILLAKLSSLAHPGVTQRLLRDAPDLQKSGFSLDKWSGVEGFVLLLEGAVRKRLCLPR